MSGAGWRFAVDRGGTFTDVVAIDPHGRRHVRKVLSDDARHGEDAALAAIRAVLAAHGEEPRAASSVRMGTTVATNALLERKGVATCLAITRGFADALEIGFQDRPELFSLRIERPPVLARSVVEIDERILADGTVRRAPDPEAVRRDLEKTRAHGCRSLAIVLVHGFAWPEHEEIVAEAGRAAGFEHVAVSSRLVPELGLVARGDTTTVDAYLTPLLREHVHRLRRGLDERGAPHAGRSRQAADSPRQAADSPRQEADSRTELLFMQSSGGLAEAERFSGKDAVLSGPAGGVVAVARAAQAAGLEQAIGFDMGGTSTDVSRWSRAQGFDRVQERRVAGVRLRSPMLEVVTVAAGGGSILSSTGRRFSVGPESAGAAPGPACYGAGGPATVTDANVVLGRIQPDWFPSCFGEEGDRPIDTEASRRVLHELAQPVGLCPENAALGFLHVAVGNMAHAIRQVSVARGRDVRDHALACFGGAGAQHACSLARSLGIRTVLLHPLAGVLSAHGIGQADLVRQGVRPVLELLDDGLLSRLEPRFERLEEELARPLREAGHAGEEIVTVRRLDLRYRGVEHALEVELTGQGGARRVRADFEAAHRQIFGFVEEDHDVEVVALRGETTARTERLPEPPWPEADGPVAPVTSRPVAFEDEEGAARRVDTPIFLRRDLGAGASVEGPALVMEDVATIVVEPGWSGRVDGLGHLILEQAGGHGAALARSAPTASRRATAAGDPDGAPSPLAEPATAPDPVRLEIFASLFMAVAEQMGEALRRVSHSTNIKERRDYSCAVFTPDGRLVANAPHQPVHLGAMGETVSAILEARGPGGLRSGQAIASNDPYHGGSHLPDITVVSPVSIGGRLAFFVANRGHHADVGGTRPGSMPPSSKRIEEEGVRFHDVTIVEDDRFLTRDVSRVLSSGPWPVRDVPERLSDLRAQVAANTLGVRRLEELVQAHGLEMVHSMMEEVLRDAAAATRELLETLRPGVHRFEDAMDDGTPVRVAVTIERDRAVFDFAGTGARHPGNLNAPRAVTKAAVLFVVRSLVGRRVPLNAGCLEPIDILIPEGSFLDPRFPDAVAGGNVETSMRLADVLLGALGALAAGQGTMNNVTFGTESYGYYETIGGGAGAGPGFDGASGVHVHLTNTRITDVEVLERRHPVVVREFSIRRGSGGAGRWRGGDGLVRALELLEPASVGVLSERRDRAPFGLDGGEPGLRGRNRLVRANGEVVELGGHAEIEAAAGDVLVVETPGGGGHGSG